MDLGTQMLVAVFLDMVVGDPRWLPHPVKLMGRVAAAMESPTRRFILDARLAGGVVAATVILGTVLLVWGMIHGARQVHPLVGDAVSTILIYYGIAARDMIDHSYRVYEALVNGFLGEARSAVGMICGRDTGCLDEAAVARAAVESVAENLVDGVTAPLFYCTIGGPVAMMMYKAINTLDSIFGYKNEQYRDFGWLSARLDDIANFIPARLSALLVPLAAWLLEQNPSQSMRIFLRDRGNHPSPNAGQTESAMAGALGVQLGGPSSYFGKMVEKPCCLLYTSPSPRDS